MKCRTFNDHNYRRKTAREVRESSELSFSFILFVIVAVFLCCQLPRLVLNMAEFASNSNEE